MGGPFNRFSATVQAIVRLMRALRRKDRPSPWEFFKDTPRVWPYLRPHKRLAFGSLSLVGFGVLIALIAPWPLALMIDTVLGNKPLPSLLGWLDGLGTYALLILAVVSGLLVT